MRYFVVIFFLLSTTAFSAAFSSVQFVRGFAVVDGVVKVTLDKITGDTSIVCDPVCEIDVNHEKNLILFSGYGSLNQMMQVNLLKNSTKSLGTLLKSDSISNPSSKPPERDTATAQPSAPSNVPARAVTIAKVSDADKLEVHLKAPYPKENTLFLFKHPGKIFILPKEKCDMNCDLQVSLPGLAETHQSFLAGESPYVAIAFDADLKGTIEVRLTNGTEAFKSSFEIQPWGEDLLMQSVKALRPMELLP